MNSKSPEFKQKALQWASNHEVFCLLDSNHYNDEYGKFNFLIAAGKQDYIQGNAGEEAFEQLKLFYAKHQNWMFGYFGYDLKNEVENLQSHNPDYLHFPDLYFFVPEYLIVSKEGMVEVIIGNQSVIEEIERMDVVSIPDNFNIPIKARVNKQSYVNTVEEIKTHILRGDIYEINYCQEFYSEESQLDPILVYRKLTTLSPTPFSGFFKIGSHFILSASPERFICKKENKLISQPIKGTARKSSDVVEDLILRDRLRDDAKQQAENVMIVDLVRNDLTKSAVPGSVKVNELFGVYSFSHVHQMISTISCELDPRTHFIDAIKKSFPMGSMTGAPKIRALELIEQFESMKRGTYSGAMGYISDNQDFDFNVLIRSIFYNSAQSYLSFHVGGAITYASDPEDEYQECMLKASAILKTLE